MDTENLLREQIANLVGIDEETPDYYYANQICALFKEALPELAREAGYIKLAKGDKVICKTAWNLLSPLISQALEENERKADWRKVKVKESIIPQVELDMLEHEQRMRDKGWSL